MRRPIGGTSAGGMAARAGSVSIAVSVAAGATTFTVMPRGASSFAQVRARPTSAAFAAPYWLLAITPRAARLPISTMRPPGDRRGASRSASATAASTCSRQRVSPAGRSSDPSVPPRMMPAACTSAVTPSAASSAAVRAVASVMSSMTALNAASSSVGGARSKPVTRQPPSMRWRAIARPMPELVPVTMACGIGCLRRLEVHQFEQLARAGDLARDELLRVVDALRYRFEQLRGQPRHEGRIAHRLLDQVVDLLRDLARRALRGPDAVPRIELEAGQPLLADGGKVGRELRARPR